jgi:cytoskeletal protein RodZ
MISWLFGDIMYRLACAALGLGAVAYALSYLVGFLPMLKPHAFVMKVVGFVLVLLGGFYVADHHGYQRRVAEDQAEIDRLNAEARAKEAELNQKIAQTGAALRKAKDDIKAKQSSIDARIDSGELRFPSTCGVQTGSNASTQSGDTSDGGRSDREALKSINSIVADGKLAIKLLNACIVEYNDAREKVNEGVK